MGRDPALVFPLCLRPPESQNQACEETREASAKWRPNECRERSELAEQSKRGQTNYKGRNSNYDHEGLHSPVKP